MAAVVVLCQAHRAVQCQALSTLAGLTATVARAGRGSPAIVIIGDVVRAAASWQDPTACATGGQAARC